MKPCLVTSGGTVSISNSTFAALEIAKETGVRLFFWLAPTFLPSYQNFELVVGDATLDLTNNEIVDLFQMLFKKAGMEMGERSNI